jgi:hypothetical protein
VAPQGANNQQKGTGETVGDLWQLVRDYAKQETIDPLKSILGFLKWGLPGAILLTTGLGFGALAILRGLQTDTGDSLTGGKSFIPYLAAFLFVAIAAALCARAITKPNRTEGRS